MATAHPTGGNLAIYQRKLSEQPLKDAEATVRGPAEHFCQVVTQRRHLDDTDLVVEGDVALDWMTKAQAYAGPPSEGPAPKGAR